MLLTKSLCKAEKKLFRIAILTRIIVILIQFAGNLCLPDHDADAFLYPKEEPMHNFIDRLINLLIGGFIRWDAQYFMHIIKYGYTYENTLAFFPAFPYIVKFTLLPVILYTFPFINEDSACVIAFLLFNCITFAFATLILFRLSSAVLNADLAYKSAVLFCVNPVTVFFVAPYTECFYSLVTFAAMLNYVELKQMLVKGIKSSIKWKYILYIFPFALSTCTRSNGIINLGFIVYLFLEAVTVALKKGFSSTKIFQVIYYQILCIVTVVISLLPFIGVEMVHYNLFCKDFETNLPQFLIDYGESKNYRLVGKFSKYNQSWCSSKIPLAYSYVQDHYWNVGFLKYYSLKQIPNFFLAAPIILIILKHSLVFFFNHKQYCFKLGLGKDNLKNSSEAKDSVNINTFYPPEMFVFVVHAFFLLLFSVLFINIQVTTRIMCSASPVLYWFCAYYFKDTRIIKINTGLDVRISNGFSTKEQKLLGCYFLGYFVIGTVLFCNFLPWT